MTQLVLGLGLAAIFVAIAGALTVITVVGASRKDAVAALAALDPYGNLPAGMTDDTDQPFKDRVLKPAFARVVALGWRLTPGGSVGKIRRRLEEGGSPAGWTVDRVLAAKVVGALAGTVLGLAGVAALGGGPLRLALVAAILGLVGFFAPNMVLYQRAHGRADAIQQALPDSLDLLSITVEAGLAFDAALAQVARNTEGPLADEFFRVLQEMQIGLGRQAALKALADRVDVTDLRQFVTAMVQADSFGIPIGNVLRVQANEMRFKRSQRAEEKAQKVPVKILFPLIFCIMPVLFIVVMGPAGVGIFHAFTK